MDEQQNQIIEQWLGIKESDVAEMAALRLIVCHPEGHSNMGKLISLGIGTHHFTDLRARAVYMAAHGLFLENRILDSGSIAQRSHAITDKSQMDYFLSLFSSDSPHSEYLDLIAAHLIDLSSERRIVEITANLEELSRDGSSWEEKKSKVTEYNHELQELTKPAISNDEDPFDLIEKEFEARDKGEKPANSKPIYTGMPNMDKWLRPLDMATNDYYNIIFGVSGNGKSSLAHMMFADSLKRGYRCAAFLGEVTADQMIKAIASQTCKVDLLNYETELIGKQNDFKAVISKIKKLWKKTMFIYDDNFIIEDIIRRCREIEKNTGKLDLVVIDHLHQLKTKQSFKDERLRYNYMSGLMKPLAMELKCPVVVVAQPSRGLKQEDRPPKKSDLKESGSLEDDADRIWAIYIPGKDEHGADQFGKLDPEGLVYQLKFKKGHEGSARVRFQKKYTLFEDFDQNEYQ